MNGQPEVARRARRYAAAGLIMIGSCAILGGAVALDLYLHYARGPRP